MGAPKVNTPPPPPPAPDPADASVREARRRTRRDQLAMAGRASTFVTGPGGVTSPAPVAGKTLLGS
mgnify:CR=1 FL=1